MSHSSYPPGAGEMMLGMFLLGFSLLAWVTYFLPGTLLAVVFQSKAGAAVKKAIALAGTATAAAAGLLIAVAFFKEWRG
jgi:hypothetical protein